MRKLPVDLQLAMYGYFIGYARQFAFFHDVGRPTFIDSHKTKWDKEFHLESIAAICRKRKISMTASAGTFWFARNGNTVTTNFSIFPALEKVKRERKR